MLLRFKTMTTQMNEIEKSRGFCTFAPEDFYE